MLRRRKAPLLVRPGGMDCRGLCLSAVVLSIALANSAAQASVITWRFDLGPVLRSPGPNSIADGRMIIDIDSVPTSRINLADSRGFYQTGWAITRAELRLNGQEFAVTGGVIDQTQCWDTNVFPNPACGFDLDRLSIWLGLENNGYLEIQDLRSPEFGLPSYYPTLIWPDRPMAELTAPYSEMIALGWYGQGLRYQPGPDDAAFQFYITGWNQVPEPGTLALFCVGVAGMGYQWRKQLRQWSLPLPKRLIGAWLR